MMGLLNFLKKLIVDLSRGELTIQGVSELGSSSQGHCKNIESSVNAAEGPLIKKLS